IWPFKQSAAPQVLGRFCDELAPTLAGCGATVAGILETERSRNDVPRLPVREDANVVVTLARFESWVTCAAHAAALEESDGWRERVAGIRDHLAGRQQILKLAPAARSRLA